MKETGYSSAIVLVLAVVFCLPAPAKGALKLTAQIPQETKPFSMIGIEVTVENQGDEVVALMDFPIPTLLRVELRDVSTNAIVVRGFAGSSIKNAPEMNLTPVTLRRGERAFFRTIVGCVRDEGDQLNSVLFRTPGVYQLRFLYPISREEGALKYSSDIATDWLTIRVSPVRSEQAEAFQELQSMPNPCWLFEPQELGFRANHIEANEWESWATEFLRKHPQSDWAAFAHLDMAYLYRARAVAASGQGNQELLQEANKHLDLISNLDQFPLSEKVRGLKASIQRGR